MRRPRRAGAPAADGRARRAGPSAAAGAPGSRATQCRSRWNGYVGRLDPPPARVLLIAAPVDGHARGPQLPHRLRHASATRRPLPQRRHRRERGVGHGPPRQPEQRGARTDLEQDTGAALARARARRPRTAPAAARAAPSTRASRPRRRPPPPVTLETSGSRGGAVRHRRGHAARTRPASAPSAASGTRARPPAPRPGSPRAASSSSSARQRVGVARDHDAVGAVHRGHRQRGSRGGDDGGHASSRRRTPPPSRRRRQRLHQPAARGDQPQRVLELEHAGDARRHVLADAVAQHRRRLDAPRPPQLGQRVLQREQRRLRVLRLGRGGPRAPSRPRASGTSSTSRSAGRAAIERVPEDRLGGVQLAAHADVLRALPGEQERDAGRLAGVRARRRTPGALPSAATAASARPPPPRCSADDGEPVRRTATRPVSACGADVGERRLRVRRPGARAYRAGQRARARPRVFAESVSSVRVRRAGAAGGRRAAAPRARRARWCR